MTRVPMLFRIGVAMCFVGHGAFGLLQKREWLTFFDRFGISEPWAMTLMPLVGGVDIAIGLLALVLPLRVLFLYAAVWTLFTAALRPLVGLSVAELLERAGNYGVPLALLAMTTGQRWFARIRTDGALPVLGLIRIAVWTTATLLIGHGWLALEGKPLLARHLATAGLDAGWLPVMGVFEIGLAVLCLVRPSRTLLIGVAFWKLGSEALFPLSGAPIWEFVERGGSYVAPLAGAFLLPVGQRLAAGRTSAGARQTRQATAMTLCLVAALAWPLIAAQQDSSSKTLPAGLLSELKDGGFIVACRHAITSHDREDQRQIDFDDPATQRVLSSAGEAQARDLGKALVTLAIPFDPILTSPFDRTRRSAELMFGRATVHEALSSASRGRNDELLELMTGPVKGGSNRLVMTHQGLLYRSFRSVRQGSIAEGDCLVARPGGDVVALISPDGWRVRNERH